MHELEVLPTLQFRELFKQENNVALDFLIDFFFENRTRETDVSNVRKLFLLKKTALL